MMISKGKRLHPLTILLTTLSKIKDLLLPLLIVFITRGFNQVESNFALWWKFGPGSAILLGTVVYSIFHWLRYRYDVEEGQLRIQHGVFIKKKQFIPLERIQTVDLTEGLFHRLFGLVRVQVQTAGGKKPEAILAAVTKQEADQLRAQLRATHTLEDKKPLVGLEKLDVSKKLPLEKLNEDNAAFQASEKNTFRLSFGKLLLAGVTAGSIGVAIPILFYILSQLNEIIPNLYTKLGDSITLSVIPILLIALLLVTWTLSIISSVLRFANYKLTCVGEELHIERGLLERRKVTLSLKRIQAIRIVEEIVWQPFGLAAVHVESAGYGKNKGETTLLMPLMHKREIEAFLQVAAPHYAQSLESNIQSLPPKAKWGYLLPTAIFFMVTSLIIAYFFLWGWYLSVLIAAALLLGFWRFKDSGWRLQDNILLLRFRRISRTTVLIPKARIQFWDVFRNPLQRRSGLSTIRISVASGVQGARFRLRGLLIEESNKLLDWFHPSGRKPRV